MYGESGRKVSYHRMDSLTENWVGILVDGHSAFYNWRVMQTIGSPPESITMFWD